MSCSFRSGKIYPSVWLAPIFLTDSSKKILLIESEFRLLKRSCRDSKRDFTGIWIVITITRLGDLSYDSSGSHNI